jgi:ribulose-5-phosphate 4-epimerase/fuculose-1-phosphate aldolase
MDEKGVIKFQCFHQDTLLEDSPELSELLAYRNLAFQKGYLGVYPNGIGFGNISIRTGSRFLVSGTATGMIEKANAAHFSLVKKYHIEHNRLWCSGAAKASSESLTHAVIYEIFPAVKAILHIHSSYLWEKYYSLMPSTSAQIAYGTPQMAHAVKELLLGQDDHSKGIFLMQGHRDGILAFATSLKETLYLIDEL